MHSSVSPVNSVPDSRPMTDDNTESGLEELRKQSTSGGGNRIDHDAAKSESAVDDLVAALNRVHESDGDLSKTLSVWDPNLSALIAVVLEDDARRTALIDALPEAPGVNVDPDNADRSDLLKLIVRGALNDADPDLFDDLREARRERAIAEVDEEL